MNEVIFSFESVFMSPISLLSSLSSLEVKFSGNPPGSDVCLQTVQLFGLLVQASTFYGLFYFSSKVIKTYFMTNSDIWLRFSVNSVQRAAVPFPKESEQK